MDRLLDFVDVIIFISGLEVPENEHGVRPASELLTHKLFVSFIHLL